MIHARQHFNDRAYRTLDNPARRLRLPDHLKQVQSACWLNEENLAATMESAGLDITRVNRINIAWPQKHPHTGHYNAALEPAQQLKARLATLFPSKDIVLAHAIYETQKLNRSESQNPTETFTRKQFFKTDTDLQEQEMPFLRADTPADEAFILSDWTVSQGTTLANLASFILHNGGRIIALTTPHTRSDYLADWRPPVPDTPEYNLWNGKGTRERLADSFMDSVAGTCDYTADECFALMDKALGRHGLALDLLTRNEVGALRTALQARRPDFRGLITELGLDPAAQDDFVRGHRQKTPAAHPAPSLS